MNELPNISILTPTYNRKKFLPLYLHNLKNLDYPKNKIEVCIYDDGTEAFIDNVAEFRKQIYPMKLIYHRNKIKKTIGEKRNYLVKNLARNKFLAFMDDDDIYHRDYLSYSFKMLKENKVGLVGSSSMLFTYPEKEFTMTGIRCENKVQIHEATMVFTKKYFKQMGGFDKSSQGEGAKFLYKNDKNIYDTENNFLMICVAHEGNTVDKKQFSDPKLSVNDKYNGPEAEILKEILGIK